MISAVSALVARLVVSGVVALVVCSLGPLALGADSSVVVSDSMAPSIRAGDVLVHTREPLARLAPGQVVVVRDAARPGELLSHRFVRRDAGGRLVTRGDANDGEDATPVRPEDVLGVVRLVVPHVGLPRVWLDRGAHLELLAALGALLVAGRLATVRTD